MLQISFLGISYLLAEQRRKPIKFNENGKERLNDMWKRTRELAKE